jgi:ubiquinol-cytochrome c reductase cytochrome b subunit
MPEQLFRLWNRRLSTFGNLAFAAFLIAVLSGIPLSITYNLDRASDSLQLLLLTNNAGVYFRSIHYWSGQFFMLFTLIHVVEHLSKGGEREVKSGLWLRLVLILLFSFFVMLSGFILKADVEGQMAKQILNGLLETIPVIGKDLRIIILGNSESLGLVYIHHLITTTLIIGIVIIEHIRRSWPELLAYVYVLGASTILAVLIPQSLQLADGSTIRGPWYFIGLQELLHWIPEPLAVIAVTFFCLAAFVLVRWLKPAVANRTKKVLLALLVFYIILTVNNWGLRDANWNSLIF